MCETLACREKMRNPYKILVCKPEGGKLIERPRRKWAVPQRSNAKIYRKYDVDMV
jgi:hypothetical protein